MSSREDSDLQRAISSGNIEYVIRALKYYDGEYMKNGWALIVAAEHGWLYIFKYLMRRGATFGNKWDVNECLRYSVEKFNLDLSKHLIKLGADVNYMDGYILKLAIECNNIPLVKHLHKKSCNFPNLDLNDVVTLITRKKVEMLDTLSKCFGREFDVMWETATYMVDFDKNN